MTDILFSSWGGVVTDNRGKPEAERQPAAALNLPLEFDKERKIKAFIGWDGIVIRDAEVNMVDLIRAYLEAVQNESCRLALARPLRGRCAREYDADISGMADISTGA